RGGLDIDLALHTYLRWADADNVPTMIRIVQSPDLPDWSTQKTGFVMKELGKLHDERGYQVLARKFSDPTFSTDAASALELAGADAQDYVVDYVFDSDAHTRDLARQLLDDFGTRDSTIAAAALHLLKSKQPEDQCAAATWLADNPPHGKEQQD